MFFRNWVLQKVIKTSKLNDNKPSNMKRKLTLLFLNHVTRSSDLNICIIGWIPNKSVNREITSVVVNVS